MLSFDEWVLKYGDCLLIRVISHWGRCGIWLQFLCISSALCRCLSSSSSARRTLWPLQSQGNANSVSPRNPMKSNPAVLLGCNVFLLLFLIIHFYATFISTSGVIIWKGNTTLCVKMFRLWFGNDFTALRWHPTLQYCYMGMFFLCVIISKGCALFGLWFNCP